MAHEYLLAIDPSGAYTEGKGTTGWCLLNAKLGIFKETGFISAKAYRSDVEYWAAHLKLIDTMAKQYDLAIIVEDYLLYAHKMECQINSRFETSQMIGVIKYHAWRYDLPFYTQPAFEVKSRWNNNILLRKGILKQYKRRMFLTDSNQPVCKHELDAIRHAMHYHTFYNK